MRPGAAWRRRFAIADASRRFPWPVDPPHVARASQRWAPMANFAMPVNLYMSTPVRSVSPGDSLDRVQELLAAHLISAVAVTEGETLRGLISRTDLLRVGRVQAGLRRGTALLTLPDRTASEIMEPKPLTVALDDSVERACDLMTKERVHRVFVVDGERLVGVLSTKDVMLAIADKRLSQPISDFMSAPVFTVEYDDPVALATERLEKARVSGLIVVENEWPIGLFTQEEALASRDAKRETPVEDVLTPAMLCLDVRTPLHRAAAQAAAMDVRRVIAVHERRVKGILSGLDFARAAAS